MKMGGIPVDDTYCEAFDGLFVRLLVTAKDEKRLERAANAATALPCTVFGEAEGGIELSVPASQTPDGRPGKIIQLWVNYGSKAPEKLEYEVAKRIRQGILVIPTTRVFNALEDVDGYIETMERVGHCGDGYETVETHWGREMINIPLMMGSFLIEKKLGYKKGVMGGNIWYFCESEEAALEVGDKAVDAISSIEGAITSFDICSAGSKVGGKYPEIGPTTNHPFCPTLCGCIDESEVPEGIVSIPEIVIDAVDLETTKKAMKACLKAALGVKGVKKISAGNFGGELGKYKIYLKDLL